ncbi:hypothetical protein V1520DRAFT_59028 [Lipomyces starkeyi]
MLEHKRQEHEFMRQEHIRRFEQEMHLLAEQHRKDEQMILQMAANEADNSANTATTISEPTTPPDYREALPSTTVGGDRIRSQTVPVGVAGVVTPNAMLRLPGQQLMTPPEDAIPRTRTLTSTSLGPSRRLSNEDPLLFDLPKLSLGRSDSQARSQSAVDVDSTYSLGQINTTKFLFGDDSASGSSSATAVNPELKFNTTDDKFPILIRRESFNQSSLSQPASSQVLSTSAQQQPATSQPGTQQQVWPFMSRGRSGHQHTLSGVSAAYGDSVNHYKDKRASVDMPSTYHLFNGGTNSSKSCSHSRMMYHTADSHHNDQYQTANATNRVSSHQEAHFPDCTLMAFRRFHRLECILLTCCRRFFIHLRTHIPLSTARISNLLQIRCTVRESLQVHLSRRPILTNISTVHRNLT